MSKEDNNATNAINKLIHAASTKFGFIKRAMGNLPNDKQYDVYALLERAQAETKHISKPRVGEQTAQTIANALTVNKIVEYIVHVKQQQDDDDQPEVHEEEEQPPDASRLNQQASIDAALK